MSKIVEFILRINDQTQKVMARANSAMRGYTSEAKNATKSNKDFGASFLKFAAMTHAIQNVNSALESITAPGAMFESKLAELSAITGKTGSELDAIGASARKLAVDFGADASAVTESYTAILSRLGPAIANNPAALNDMGKNVLTLSKTMGNDAVGAMDALTTAMLQYNVDISDPIAATEAMKTQMNIMAASAKVGSATVPEVAAALKVAGSSAYLANVSFSEANAALQVLAKGALKGSEGGTALRNVMSKLQEGRFLPKDTQDALRAAGVDMDVLSDKSLSFADRMSELQKVQGDSALISKMFGAENARAANIILQNIDQMKEWQGQMIGTTEAQTQAEIVMNTFNEEMAHYKALLADAGIAVFNYTKKFLPFLTFATQGIQLYSQLAPAIAFVRSLISGLAIRQRILAAWTFIMNSAMMQSIKRLILLGAQYSFVALTAVGSFIASLIAATAAQLGLNVAMNANPIGLMVVGLVAVGAAVYAIIKHWDTIKKWLLDLVAFVLKYNPFAFFLNLMDNLFPGLKSRLSAWWGNITKWFQGLVDKILEVWDRVKSALGMGKDEAKISVEAKRANVPADIAGVGIGDQPSLPNENLSSGVSKGAETIAGAGEKQTNIIINLDALIREFNQTNSKVSQNMNEMESLVEEALLRVINSANQIATN